MSFSFLGTVNSDGSWSVIPAVPNGETVTNLDLSQVLIAAAAQLIANPGWRIRTLAEVEAAQAEEKRNTPPAHWKPSGEGTNTSIVIGGPSSFSVAWERSDGQRCDAPVANLEKAPTADTVRVLAEYDAAHPVGAPAIPEA